MKNTINICIASTCNQYLKYVSSFYESLYNNINPNYEYNLYFLSNKIISDRIKNKLFCRKIKNLKIFDIYIDEDENFSKYCNLKSKSKILLYRLILHKYINVDKILFLDCDIIIRGDISELYFTDLGNNIIGASKDIILRDTPILKSYKIKKYFNAGVQLINLKKWEDENIGEKALEFLDYNYNNLPLYDQDTLNILLKDKWLCLSPRWNGIGWDKIGYKESQYSEEEYKELNNPVIVHFAGITHRPREGLICLHPFWYLYFKYIFKTKYRNFSDIYMFIFRIFSSNIFVCYIGKAIITILGKIRKLCISLDF